MMLTAQAVSGMIGPESPLCNCSGCQIIASVKAMICEPVTQADKPDEPVWLAVLVIAASRAVAQGLPPDALAAAVNHGAQMAIRQNPLLCQAAPAGPVN